MPCHYHQHRPDFGVAIGDSPFYLGTDVIHWPGVVTVGNNHYESLCRFLTHASVRIGRNESSPVSLGWGVMPL